MMAIFSFLLLSGVAFVSWRELYRAYTSGSIEGQGGLFRRSEQPFYFWLVVVSSILGAILCPILLAMIGLYWLRML